MSSGTKIRLKITRKNDTPEKVEKKTSTFTIPDNYKDFDLTEQELQLLEKFSKTKKIVLKVKSGGISDIKAYNEERRKKKMSAEEDIRKRPRIETAPRHFEDTSHRFNAGTKTNDPDSRFSEQYDEEGMVIKSEWHSLESKSGPLVVESPPLSFEKPIEGNKRTGNSVVVWGTWPENSTRFSINLCPTPSFQENDPRTTVLYHFNPRDPPKRKPAIVQNVFIPGQKWCKREDIQMNRMPISKGKIFELRITISPDLKFFVFIDGIHVSTFSNQCDITHLQPTSILYLIVPVIEEHYGDKENVRIHGVWWGYHESETNKIVPGASPPTNRPRSTSGSHRRGNSTHWSSSNSGTGVTLHVSGFPGLSRDELQTEILRLLQDYGIEHDPVSRTPRIKLFEEKGFAFVTLVNDTVASNAIQNLHGQIGRAGVRLAVSRARKQTKRY